MAAAATKSGNSVIFWKSSGMFNCTNLIDNIGDLCSSRVFGKKLSCYISMRKSRIGGSGVRYLTLRRQLVFNIDSFILKVDGRVTLL